MVERLILASTSRSRAALLAAAGVAHDVEPARIDEEEYKRALRAEEVAPRDQADALAEAKALSVSRLRPGRLTLGADQILAFDGAAMDKPGSVDEARAQLRALRGNRHDLFSAAVLAVDGAPVWRHVARARLWMRPFSDGFLEDYLAAMGDDVTTTVGGYKLEGLGAQLFTSVDGDHFAILGLPLLEVLDHLRIRGFVGL